MRKVIAGLLIFSVLAAVVFAISANPVDAGWFWFDSRWADPVRACRDGLYLGIASESEAVDVLMRGVLESNDEVVYEGLYEIGEDLVYDATLYAWAGYFLERWDRPLTPGDRVIIFPEGEPMSDYLPRMTVKDCYVIAPEASSAFTFQGTLNDGEQPANGAYDFRFRAWDAPTGGHGVGEVVTIDDVEVVDGAFTVPLDFGDEAISTGRARWLDMGVRPGESTGRYTTLSPRQEIMAVPYAQTLTAGAVISASHPGPALTVVNQLDQALEISGARGALTVDAEEGTAVSIQDTIGKGMVVSGTWGIDIDSPVHDGIDIDSPGYRGVDVDSPGGDGVYVSSAGQHGVNVTMPISDGVSVSSPGQHGVNISSPTDSGVNIDGAGTDGVSISSAGQHGVSVTLPVNNGVNIESAGGSGVDIDSPAIDGVSVDSPGWSGMYVYSAGYEGVYVSGAGWDGIYASTENDDFYYGLYTPNDIRADNVSANSISLVAQVSGDEALQAGDIAAAAGVTSIEESGEALLPQVVGVNATNGAAVIGVVESRMVLEEIGPERDGAEDAGTVAEAFDREPRLRRAEGPAQPGEYVSLIIYGVTYVRVDPAATVESGMRLTAADVEGTVRPLVTTTVDGTRLTEDAPVVGIALAAPEPGSDLVPVFVTIR